jgi:dihydropteroate synthase
VKDEVKTLPRVMGVLNVTPDSFSDGGQWEGVDDALAQTARMIDDGADVIDVGGESTRPGAEPVDEATEHRRVVPVIEQIHARWPDIEISVDTQKPAVARAAVTAGATIINDVTASLEEVAAEMGVGWIAMHAGGPSKTMQNDPHYDDVVEEVADYLESAVGRARAHGIERVWVDPGVGFGKTVAHNLKLVANFDRFTRIAPAVLAVSRKKSIGDLHALSDGVDMVDADDRLEGSVTMATWGVHMGADLVRVHDVRATVHAVRMVTS